MKSRNSHRNTIVTKQNGTSRKTNKFFRSITTGGSFITGGIAKEMQLLPVSVLRLQLFSQTKAYGSKQ